MKHPKSIFATLSAVGLLVTQPAAAATEARAATPVGQSEELAGGIPSGAWPAVIAIVAVAIFSIINASDDDDEDPVSP